MKFNIHMLGEGDADCFLLCFENEDKRETFNLLVDGGKTHKDIEKIQGVLENSTCNTIDGVIITHMHDDHVGGCVSFFEDILKIYESNKSVFLLNSMFLVFNEYQKNIITITNAKKITDLKIKIQKSLERICSTSKEKVYFDTLVSYDDNYQQTNSDINKHKRDGQLKVNFFSAIKRGLLPLELVKKDEVYITFLTPDYTNARDLMIKWRDAEGKGENSIAGQVTNNTSISMLIEFGGKKVLMSGDAPFTIIKKNINKIGLKKIKTINYIKMSHHGSDKSNNRLMDLAKQVNCKKFFVSAECNAKHPHKERLKELHEMGDDIVIYGTNEWSSQENIKPFKIDKLTNNKLDIMNL